MRERAQQYYLLTRMDRPIGIFLLLWPTLWALWVAAEGLPNWHVLLVFVSGVFLMRSAGCVINDYADREFDPLVSRTRERPIAAGRVKPNEALLLFAVLCLLAFALVLTMNALTIKLSFVGAALAAVYPFMKRYTHLPQVVLGMAFGWAIPMAFAAQIGSVPKVAWLMYVINVVWSVVYDTMYAMADREDDIKAGVKSTAILFGDADRVIIAILQGMVLLGLLLLGQQLGLGMAYYLGLAVAVALGVYQQFLIRARQPAQCFKAFLNNNWLGAAVFAGLVLSYL
ncbi:MAG: 4-hydroxybenzoate octaprenyltransferase [Gammaproteobacteria bacterium]|nr:4-hydroxybenzoate octaprenyltransferase [Gammaproteobacteria bacterium]